MTAAGAMRASRISSEEVREAVFMGYGGSVIYSAGGLWWCRSDGEESAACEETGNTPLVVRLRLRAEASARHGWACCWLPGAIAVHLC